MNEQPLENSMKKLMFKMAISLKFLIKYFYNNKILNMINKICLTPYLRHNIKCS